MRCRPRHRMLVYERMWADLVGRRNRVADYSELSLADRRAIIEILRETKMRTSGSTSRQRKNPERVGGDDGDVLLAVAALVGDRVRVPSPFHLRHPQLPAGSRVERTKTIVIG